MAVETLINAVKAWSEKSFTTRDYVSSAIEGVSDKLADEISKVSADWDAEE